MTVRTMIGRLARFPLDAEICGSDGDVTRILGIDDTFPDHTDLQASEPELPNADQRQRDILGFLDSPAMGR